MLHPVSIQFKFIHLVIACKCGLGFIHSLLGFIHSLGPSYKPMVHGYLNFLKTAHSLKNKNKFKNHQFWFLEKKLESKNYESQLFQKPIYFENHG
jgi:hypothetical protein